jgi:hypothetical protein
VKPPPNVVRDPTQPACDMPGCELAGEYKAPFSPQEIDKYRFFCLDHVREYNSNWDYFTGMHASQIEDFMKDAMFGHRPTWKINYQKTNEEKLEEALHDMLHGQRRGAREQKRKRAEAMRIPEEERKALAVLNLEGEVALQDIKKQYKLLVKKHHPDVNRNDSKAEERFKRITEAYQDLMKLRANRTE